MVDVILSSPNPNAFKDDAGGWPADRSPVVGGVLNSVFYWNGRCDVATSYIGKYTEVDAVRDGNGAITTPAVLSVETYVYLRVTQTCFDGLLDAANPTGRMPGGTKIEYASGVEDLVRDLSDPDYGTYGSIPVNGLQHGFV